MKVVVTGASGNLGTALLTDPGTHWWEITAVARRPPPRANPPDARVQWLALDIGLPGAEAELVRAFVGADAVVHLAWAINPPRGDPPMERTNIDGTRHLLSAVAASGVRHLVAVSSAAAYATGPRWAGVDERWPCHGIAASRYSRGKCAFEQTLHRFTSQHPDLTVGWLRPCGIVQDKAGGEFAQWLLPPFLPTSVIGIRALPVPLWPGFRMQLVHADDVAAALRLLVEHRAQGPFNVAAPYTLTAAHVVRALHGMRVPLPRRVLSPLAWASWRAGLQPLHPSWLTLADKAPLLNTDKIRRELGWNPAYDAPEALDEVLRGLRAGIGTDSPALPGVVSTRFRHRLRAISLGKPLRQKQS